VAPPRQPEERTRILFFNLVFFGSLAWLGTAVTVSNADGWWYELGQVGLALAGIVLFWIAWWYDERGFQRRALQLAGPAVAVLSVWATSVYPELV
jgi:hypothetical protein